jgi:hypothetical protein
VAGAVAEGLTHTDTHTDTGILSPHTTFLTHTCLVDTPHCTTSLSLSLSLSLPPSLPPSHTPA